ncbi:hypothetical protein GCM10027160_43090 [Streptomyces calidiresistens]
MVSDPVRVGHHRADREGGAPGNGGAALAAFPRVVPGVPGAPSAPGVAPGRLESPVRAPESARKA